MESDTPLSLSTVGRDYVMLTGGLRRLEVRPRALLRLYARCCGAGEEKAEVIIRWIMVA